MPRIILSEHGAFLSKSGEQFRITRKDEQEVLIPAQEGGARSRVLGRGISVSLSNYLSVNSTLCNIR